MICQQAAASRIKGAIGLCLSLGGFEQESILPMGEGEPRVGTREGWV
jgi:hypothetical protein